MPDEDPEVISVAPDGRPAKGQPAWREDFPLDWPEDEYRSRREFVAFLMLTSAAFVAGQFWILLIQGWRKVAGQPPVKEIASVNELAVGQSKLFEYPKQGNRCILVRLSDTNFVAYGQKCTHLSCPVLPRPDLGTCIVLVTKAGLTFAAANLWLVRHDVHCRESVWKCAGVKCSRMGP
jgi:Rieske Fe-S protein